jgi:hypothetical protein
MYRRAAGWNSLLAGGSQDFWPFKGLKALGSAVVSKNIAA